MEEGTVEMGEEEVVVTVVVEAVVVDVKGNGDGYEAAACSYWRYYGCGGRSAPRTAWQFDFCNRYTL